MIQLFQQRDFGNKINATFQYLGQNFGSLALALLYIAGPVALVAAIASGIMQANFLKIAADMSSDQDANPMAVFQMMSQFTSPTFWLATLCGLLANVAVILTTYAHMKVYDQHRDTPISVAEVWAEVQPAIGRGIVISILTSIVVSVGFVFLFVPGLYLAIVLSLSLSVTVFEKTDFGATWSRCFQLIRDKWWSTFGLILMMIIIVFLVGLVFAAPTAIILFFTGAKTLASVSVVWLMLANVINIVGRTILNVVIYTAIGFQYTNLVERQEGRGMAAAIDSIGTLPTQPRATDEGEY